MSARLAPSSSHAAMSTAPLAGAGATFLLFFELLGWLPWSMRFWMAAIFIAVKGFGRCCTRVLKSG